MGYRKQHNRNVSPETRVAMRSEFSALQNAIGRCHVATHQSFHNYGARGIEVFKPWRDDAQLFLDYMGAKASPDLTLERIDNDKNYEPGNVCWASRKTQTRNRRETADRCFDRNTQVTYNGETRSYREWSELLGLQLAAITQRVRRGLPVDQVLAPRQRAERFYVEYKGERRTLFSACQDAGVSYNTACRAIKKGWPLDDVIAGRYFQGARPKDLGWKMYEYRGQERTIQQIATMAGVPTFRLRWRLAKGWPLDLAISTPRYEILDYAKYQTASNAQPSATQAVVGQLLDEQDDPLKATIEQAIKLLAGAVDHLGKRPH